MKPTAMFFLPLLTSIQPLAAQAKACGDCPLAVRLVTVLGTEDGPGALAGFGYVKRNSQGSYFVSQGVSIEMFDSSGHHVRSIGRPGAGPGEFQDISGLFMDENDTLHVADGRALRRTLIDPDGAMVRTHRFPLRHERQFAMIAADRFIMNADVQTADRIGYPLHAVDSSGTIVRSFGADNPSFRYDLSFATLRELSRGGADGRFWVAMPWQYVLEQWDVSGRLHQRIVREVEWFPPRASPISDLEENGGPAPIIRGIRDDRAGRLWVVIATGDPRWRDAVAYGTHPDGAERPTVVDRDRLYDTVIEVLDAQTRRLVATASLDESVSGHAFADDRHVYGYWEDDGGTPRIRVWRLEFALE